LVGVRSFKITVIMKKNTVKFSLECPQYPGKEYHEKIPPASAISGVGLDGEHSSMCSSTSSACKIFKQSKTRLHNQSHN